MLQTVPALTAASARRPPAGSGETRVPGLRGGDSGCRAVSYALGFVIVFSVVVAGTLALFVAGVDLLSEADQDETLAANAENVDVIHSEVGDVAAGGGDRRDFALELVDAQLRFTDSESVGVRIEIGAAAGSPEVLEYETRALQYEVVPHDTTFVYALGHAYRVDDGGGAVSERPPVFEVGDRQTRLVVPVLTGPTAGGPTGIGVGGTGEREVVALGSNASSLTRTGTDGDGTVAGTVTVENVAHPSVWETALEATGFDDVAVEADGTAVTGTFESRQLTVQQADIAFEFEGGSP